ncbi:MAG: hypothetical protein NC548_27750 [Lachnospiraceae bacterium]|nr:hypothetical protein [Lachnospiraceae bacterium]
MLKKEYIEDACARAVIELGRSLEHYLNENNCAGRIESKVWEWCNSDHGYKESLWDDSFITKIARLTAARQCTILYSCDYESEYIEVHRPRVEAVVATFMETKKRYDRRKPLYFTYRECVVDTHYVFDDTRYIETEPERIRFL